MIGDLLLVFFNNDIKEFNHVRFMVLTISRPSRF
jgi:hypothetical protein